MRVSVSHAEFSLKFQTVREKVESRKEQMFLKTVFQSLAFIQFEVIVENIYK